MTIHRKLIEVSLPLEAINVEAAREKSIRHGHPSTLHLWWARRPLAAARAVLFAQLVDDPSSNEDEYRAEALRRGVPADRIDGYIEGRVAAERERLHEIIRKLVVWENLNDGALYRQAHDEILLSTDGNPPSILDPFAGGGTIPLEAQRLGLDAHASDLNPVAVLINKALIEIPPKFADRQPVFPGAAASRLGTWPKATGMVEDVRCYGRWMRDEAERRIGHLYPDATLSDGSKVAVIAWVWGRTVVCPNPACGIRMPLVRSWWLSKKKGNEAYVVPEVVDQRVLFRISHDMRLSPAAGGDGTVGRAGATCIACGAGVGLAHIRSEGRARRIGAQLIATVADGGRHRIFLAPTEEQETSADVARPGDPPEGDLPNQALGFRVQGYGFQTYAELFTNRQLTALTTFSDLVIEARARVFADALAANLEEGKSLVSGGVGANAYADAVATYLGLGVSRLTDISNAMCRWENSKAQVRNLFGRQAISMIWDYAEAPPFGKAAGSYEVSLGNLIKAIAVAGPKPGNASQEDAAVRDYSNAVICTDPPYYDNIGYSDLSDFFYVWLRRSLQDIYPGLLSTILVPKADELVANPYRHGGKEGARSFFEDGFGAVFARARASAQLDYPSPCFMHSSSQRLSLRVPRRLVGRRCSKG